MPKTHRHFFSCDWGTSSFRLKLVSLPDCAVLHSLESAHGVGIINKNLGPQFPPFERAMAFAGFMKEGLVVLMEQAEMRAESIPVLVSGMASSSVGWRELPYAQVPFPVDGSAVIAKCLDLDFSPNPTVPVYLISGLATQHDMMRGEETQVIGLLGMPEFADYAKQGILVLPGTHSKHVVVRDGQIQDVQTYMTGELFDVLSNESLLRFTTEAASKETDMASFKLGVEASGDPGLLRSLFRVRTRGVLESHSALSNRSYLSGLLIGAELVELKKSAKGVPILVAAAEPFNALYESAAAVVGFGNSLRMAAPSLVERSVLVGHSMLLARCESMR